MRPLPSFIFLFLSLLSQIFPVAVFAEDSVGNLPTGPLFSLYPAKIEASLNSGDKVLKSIKVINTLGYDAVFSLSVEDIGPSANIKEPATLYGEVDGPFTVRNLVTLPYKTIAIKDGETKTVPIQISAPKVNDLGGRYGVVLFSVSSDGGDSGQSTKIVSRLGATLLIKSTGELKESGQVVSFGVIGRGVRFYNPEEPVLAQVTFKNDGNIHLNTYGAVTAKNIFGREVFFAELDPWYVLPGAVRLREIPLENKLRFGPYRLEAMVNRGYDNQIDELSAWVFVFPAPWISIVLMALLIGIGVWFIARRRSQYDT